MNDMRSVIIPKSDQLNADDLLAGPKTITITEVKIRPGTEQPVSIFYEGDGGKPYKCCKSMARVLVHCWGPDANNYVGRSMTLYCDPKVLWGGLAVGGIRISHMTDISGAQTMALTITKGSKKPFTVKPLTLEATKRRTFGDWLADIEVRLKAADSLQALDAILIEPAVKKVVESLTNGNKERWETMRTEHKVRLGSEPQNTDEELGEVVE